MSRDLKKRQCKEQDCRKFGVSISRSHLKTFTEKRQWHKDTFLLVYMLPGGAFKQQQKNLNFKTDSILSSNFSLIVLYGFTATGFLDEHDNYMLLVLPQHQ